MSDNIERCPTCGSAVLVAGEVTKHYVPYIPDHSAYLEEIESLKAQLAECRDNLPEQAAKDLLIGINKGLADDELLAFARRSLKGTNHDPE